MINWAIYLLIWTQLESPMSSTILATTQRNLSTRRNEWKSCLLLVRSYYHYGFLLKLHAILEPDMPKCYLTTNIKNRRAQAQFRFTSGSLGLHRWPYDVSHNSIFKKLNFAKFADRRTYGKKVTSKDPFCINARDLLINFRIIRLNLTLHVEMQKTHVFDNANLELKLQNQTYFL